MAIIGTFIQQPADRLDYDVSYDPFLVPEDFVVASTVQVDGDLLILQPIIIEDGRAVKIWVSGGTSNTTYKATITTTTDLGRVKQDEIRFRIKDF